MFATSDASLDERRTKKMKYYTADREAGNRIEAFATREDAERAITAYEAEDMADGTYTPDFYAIEEVD